MNNKIQQTLQHFLCLLLIISSSYMLHAQYFSSSYGNLYNRCNDGILVNPTKTITMTGSTTSGVGNVVWFSFITTDAFGTPIINEEMVFSDPSTSDRYRAVGNKVLKTSYPDEYAIIGTCAPEHLPYDDDDNNPSVQYKDIFFMLVNVDLQNGICTPTLIKRYDFSGSALTNDKGTCFIESHTGTNFLLIGTTDEDMATIYIDRLGNIISSFSHDFSTSTNPINPYLTKEIPTDAIVDPVNWNFVHVVGKVTNASGTLSQPFIANLANAGNMLANSKTIEILPCEKSGFTSINDNGQGGLIVTGFCGHIETAPTVYNYSSLLVEFTALLPGYGINWQTLLEEANHNPVPAERAFNSTQWINPLTSELEYFVVATEYDNYGAEIWERTTVHRNMVQYRTNYYGQIIHRMEYGGSGKAGFGIHYDDDITSPGVFMLGTSGGTPIATYVTTLTKTHMNGVSGDLDVRGNCVHNPTDFVNREIELSTYDISDQPVSSAAVYDLDYETRGAPYTNHCNSGFWPLGSNQIISSGVSSMAKSGQKLKLYPTVLSSENHLTVSGISLNKASSFRCYNVFGQEIPVTSVQNAEGNTIVKFNTPIDNGFYFLAIKVGNETQMYKFLIKD